MKRRDEAIETIELAIQLHHKKDDSQEKEQVSLDAQSFNRI